MANPSHQSGAAENGLEEEMPGGTTAHNDANSGGVVIPDVPQNPRDTPIARAAEAAVGVRGSGESQKWPRPGGCRIMTIANQKGGVGKTTTAVNLAYLCAAAGWATLLWDLDAQGAATYILRCEPHENASAKKLVAGKRELTELPLASGYDKLDVLPSDHSYRNFDVHLSARKHPTERLLRMSRSLRDAYAVLFLDCPPGISLLSENVLRAADAVVVPLLPTPLSVRMLEQL
jgi:Mrp family chromosome partitioning ATPase